MVSKYFQSIRLINITLIGILYWGLLTHHYLCELNFKIDHFWLFLSIVFTLCSGYLINNYYDFESDKINNKKIEGISRKYYLKAYLIHLILSFFFLFISNLSGGWIQLVMICHLLVFIYSFKFQHIPLLGNILVAFLCAIVICIPEHLAGNEISISNFNLKDSISSTYILFCFGLTIIREIIKDLEDYEGDSSTKSKTLPVLLGIKTSSVFVVLFSILVLILLIFGLTSTPFDLIYLIFYLPMIGLHLYLVIQLIKTFNQLPYAFLSRLIKIKFFVASAWLYISML